MAIQDKQFFPILLVDDDPFIISALKEIIKGENYQILTAENGEEAIKILKSQLVALIICDQYMPGMKGIDVLKEALVIQPDATRIIMTSHSDMNMVMKAINIGQINQFILKPWDNASLMQTIDSLLDRYLIIQENKELHELILTQHQALTKNHEILRREMQLGGRIHETLLLGKIPVVSGFAIDAITIPSNDIDGDFFEFYRPIPQVLDLVIGDVMGKGIPAALVGTALKAQFNRYALPLAHTQTIKKHNFWEEDLLQPQEILTLVHRETAASLINLEYFASLFYGRFNLQKRTLTFVDCGFTKPIHYRAKEKRAVLLSGDNVPLGSVEAPDYHPSETSYDVGDIIILYSDGISEAMSPSLELYGSDPLIKLVENHPEADPSTLLQMIKLSIIAFAKKENFDDDITVIIVKIEKFEAPKLTGNTAKFFADLSQLKEIREFIGRFTSRAPGDSEELTIQLQLAINELFCNIVQHGYQGEKGTILVEVKLETEGIAIEIADQGQIFDPKKIEEPNLIADKTNGYGWYIIRAIADQVTYMHKHSKDGWNHLKIFKKYIEKGKKMHFAHSTHNNVLIITPQENTLDAKDASEFKEKVIDLITNINLNHVVFDLNHVKFIDSSGLGVFLSILRNLHNKNGELKLACLTKVVRTVFELVSMHKIFEIYNSTDEAVRSFK